MSEILAFAEALWRGEAAGRHPWRAFHGLVEVGPKLWFYSGFANMIAKETPGGLLLVDPGSAMGAWGRIEALRAVTRAPVDTVVYTHGHVDHILGVEAWDAEASESGAPRPRVVAHEGVAGRIRRYAETAGYNGIVNLRQFRGGDGEAFWPTEMRAPDVTFTHGMTLDLHGVTVHLHHARGETDDHTWLHLPDEGVICCGDLFSWVAPNAGNPQKVQRFAGDWARALRRMAALEADTVLPGHGPPLQGRDRVKQALAESAEYLEFLETETLRHMNAGATLDHILHTVTPPPHLLTRPYLKPSYDEPEFIVRNVWRLFGGWYDGTPSHLKPAPEAQQGAEILRLAGGVGPLLVRAEALAGQSDWRMACHLVDWAWHAEPSDPEVRRVRGEIYAARARAEQSTMAVGIFRATARDMGAQVGGGPLLREILSEG